MLTRTGLWLALAALSLGGCSKPFESATLHVRYEPPAGFKLIGESATPGPIARFSGGLSFARVDHDLPIVSNPAPEPDLAKVLEAAGLSAPGTPRPCRDGTLPAGAVFRCEIAGAGARSLMYLFPRSGHYLVVLFSAPEDRYGTEAARVERSLSTLAFDSP